MLNEIVIRGALEHNLKNISLKIPRNKLVVITGVSGSGKSSLAFDTIFAEGQRKYMESLSSYARQFLQQMKKPNVEIIEGLPPTIAIEQRTSSHNPRSTVATTTEIYDYLRLLFARVGTPKCWHKEKKGLCHETITRQSPSQVVKQLLKLPEGSRLTILAPLVLGKKGHHKELVPLLQKQGFVRARVNGKIIDLDEDLSEDDENPFSLARYEKHSIEACVSRTVVRSTNKKEIADGVETAFELGKGTLIALSQKDKKSSFTENLYSEHFSCPKHPECSLAELEPRLFSFNSPYGACETCNGLGTKHEFNLSEVIKDHLSITSGAFKVFQEMSYFYRRHYMRLIRAFCRKKDISQKVPFKDLEEKDQHALLYGGTKGFSGAIPLLHQRLVDTENTKLREKLQKMLIITPCPTCEGDRLKVEAINTFLSFSKDQEVNISTITHMSVVDAEKEIKQIHLNKEQKIIAAPILKEIHARLSFLNSVGLEYLHLDRKTASLSGGEAQRIRLATQIGTGLVGVCYVLDEPTIGLHPCDNDRLIRSLRNLSNIGNTVLIVEHDESVMQASDYIVDIGPGPGVHGGEVVATGTFSQICKNKKSITGAFLSKRRVIKIPEERRKLKKSFSLKVKGAEEHNLKKLNVHFPLGGFLVVTGVSGSGKSTLVNEILLKGLYQKLGLKTNPPGKHKSIEGADQIDRVLHVDQAPIGKTPRSNPATYTGLFDDLRALFAKVPEAQTRGYTPGRFSFNVKGGRCEECQGQGTKKVEMHFLPDVYVTCNSCQGKRYNAETLEVQYKGKNISDVLEMTIEDAALFFSPYPKMNRILKCLCDVGLEYVQLGQPSPTLSGGEAQRIKLASELCRVSRFSSAKDHTLYILDEPTTGLHFADLEKVLAGFQALVDSGNTVIVIEHNLDIIKCADWIIDLGPQGGERGGEILAEGTPEKLTKVKVSQTGKYLTQILS